MTTAFETLLQDFEVLARTLHENANRLSGLEFADERNLLNDAERAELIRLRDEPWDPDHALDAMLARLRAAHAVEWAAHVERVLRTVRAMIDGTIIPRSPASPTPGEFDVVLAHELSKAWDALATRQPLPFSLAWTIALGREMLDRFGASVTLLH